MKPETRHSFLQISLIVSLAASLLFAFGSYGMFAMFVCWNRCTDLMDDPVALAILSPIIVGPLLANLAAILDWKLGREIKTWKLIVIMLGGAGIVYVIGATILNAPCLPRSTARFSLDTTIPLGETGSRRCRRSNRPGNSQAKGPTDQTDSGEWRFPRPPKG
jgi:hypothetical protein